MGQVKIEIMIHHQAENTCLFICKASLTCNVEKKNQIFCFFLPSSLTEESTGPRTQDADILFDLHKREIDEKDEDNDEEVISIAHFLEVIN